MRTVNDCTKKAVPYLRIKMHYIIMVSINFYKYCFLNTFSNMCDFVIFHVSKNDFKTCVYFLRSQNSMTGYFGTNHRKTSVAFLRLIACVRCPSALGVLLRSGSIRQRKGRKSLRRLLTHDALVLLVSANFVGERLFTLRLFSAI